MHSIFPSVKTSREIFAALALGKSRGPPANHPWRAQEDLAQSRRGAKYGFPQFTLLFLCHSLPDLTFKATDDRRLSCG